MHSTDALPLPPHPSLEQYRKLAKELAAAVKRGDAATIRDCYRAWFERLGASDEAYAERLAQYWTGAWRPKDVPPPRPTLTHAQYVIARIHGFGSWAALARHIETLGTDSDGARFEAAVDAVVSGDSETLRRLLREHPELVRARSTRGHGCTLLHYVSANGVEGYRQKTPPNIVAITKLLLDAGADIHAKAKCYGGGDQVLGLTATSMHPHNAGIMIPLLETLVEAGADVSYRDGGWGIVRSCLANGQPEAAQWLADRGAAVGLEGAAGLGRLDLVQAFVAPDGTLRNGATPAQLEEAWEQAAWHGRTDVVAYLLDTGVEPTGGSGATALHRAAYAGHADLVDLLLERGARVDVRDEEHGATPLEWAKYARGERGRDDDRAAYGRIVAALEARTPSGSPPPGA